MHQTNLHNETHRIASNRTCHLLVLEIRNITNVITIRQLLSHTSGIFNIISPSTSPEYFKAITNDTGRVWTPEELLTYVKKPAFAPGTSWQYSNTGYVILGMIIRSATQSSLAENFRARFFEPLELTSTFSSWVEQSDGEMPRGYFDFTFSGSGRSEDTANHGAPFVSYYTSRPGSAGIVSTAENIARWMRRLYGGLVISPDSTTMMTTIIPESVDGSSAYGMGTERLQTSKGDFFGHSGGAFGFSSYAVHSPKHDMTVVVWINENRLDGYCFDMLIALIDAL